MPIFVGGQYINKRGKHEPDPITIQRSEETEPNLQFKRQKIQPFQLVNSDDGSLINYKASSFITDMLQSDKD